MNWTELASTDQQQVDQVTWRSRVRQLHDLIGGGETRTVGARWVLDTCWHVFQCGCLQQLRSPTGVRSSSVLWTSLKITDSTRGKVLSWEYRSPRKRNSRPPASVILCWVSWVENVLLIYYASSDLLVFTLEIGLFTLEKNPRFTAFLDSNLHTQLAIVTENDLGLAFPPRNLPKKFFQIRPRFI